MVDTGINAYASLGSDLNKRPGDGTQETAQGVASTKLPELTLDMSDEQIVKLTEQWESLWKDSPKKAEWEKRIKDNEDYWLGKQFDKPQADKSRAMVDNLIFEAVETYLPQVTRRNPEPLTKLHSSETKRGEEPAPEKLEYVEKVKDRLSDLADENVLRLKLKKAARHWSIFELGVAKVGWDLDSDNPTVKVIRPQKVILDPEATTDEDGYTGDRIGEIRKMPASKILTIMGEGANAEVVKAVKDKVKDNLATELQFVEWWTPEYFCWKLGKHILLKKRNPHWNYDTTQPTEMVDDFGAVTVVQQEILGMNHFSVPDMPYIFLSVFNLGDQPMDKTSLIGQNLANQDKINKRNKQIDKNADRMNGGMVVSLERSGLTKPQAKEVSEALRKGGVVVIPSGSPRDAIDTYSPNGLPADVYNDLVDTRARARDIFGTTGSTPSAVQQEETVRGKIMNRGLDTDRIGGGISEYLEQMADKVYNWWVQLLYVYDPDFQFIGGARPPRLVVSVKEGSLLPKDSIAIANQAIELGTAGKMSLVDMYKRLEYPNPEQMAANVWLETNAPHLLYKDNPLVQEALAQQAAAAHAEAIAETEKEVMSGERKHEQDMEKEQMKGEMKMHERSMMASMKADST